MQVALVTGASRGVGRGVAISLAKAGFKVLATGRSIAAADLPDGIVRIPCDHLHDEETAAAFARVASEANGLDVLVNSSWGGYERMVENGVFTWGAPFWEQPNHRWTSMLDAGVHAAFVSASHAARIMVRTEAVLLAAKDGWLDLSNSESPEFIGRVVVALSRHQLMERTGKILIAAAVAAEYGIEDVDRRRPVPLTLDTA